MKAPKYADFIGLEFCIAQEVVYNQIEPDFSHPLCWLYALCWNVQCSQVILYQVAINLFISVSTQPALTTLLLN